MPPRYDDSDDDRDWDEHDEDEDFDADNDGDDSTVNCPSCGRPVYDDAEQCPHCGEYLSDADLAGRSRPIWIVVTVVIVVGVLLIYALR